MKKIITYKLRHSDQEMLAPLIKQHSGLSLESVNQSEQLFDYDFSDVAGCFLFVDESMSIKTFENILQNVHRVPVNVILKYKDFDYLMLCHRYQVQTVFEAKLNEREVENALVRMDLLNHKGENLPVMEAMNLISSPFKIKTNVELRRRLAEYLDAFDSVENFCLFGYEEDEKIVLGNYAADDFFEEIKEIKLPRKYIGFEKVLDNGKYVDVLTPVFCPDNQNAWLAIKVKKEEKDYVLNSLFYKFLENVLIYRMNKVKEHNLEILASTDDVTGLYNQRRLSQDLESAVKHHEKHDKNFSLMFIDIDHFKSVNDNYGHLIGSKLLTDIGEVLSLILRSTDHIYRYGGDEFVVIMPTVDIKTVHDIAGRVLTKIKNKSFDIGNGETYRLSVSIGIAEYPTDANSALEIIRFADEMMYMSKRSGRGKVFHINEVKHVDAGSK